MKFRLRVREAIAQRKSNLCVGIDPDLESINAFGLRELERFGAERYLEHFGCSLVDAAVGAVPAVKLQSAYFEAAGAPGVSAMSRIISYSRSRGLIAILDAKRGDIASTMKAYGRAVFDSQRADAITVTPYMGLDVVEPLISPWLQADRGVYLVWVTSNASGYLVQRDTHELVLESYREFVEKNRIEDACGLVLGATRVESLHPGILESLSREMLLVPGVGAQGGKISDRFAKILSNNGCSLVNVSRGILPAKDTTIGSWADFGRIVSDNIKQFSKELAY